MNDLNDLLDRAVGAHDLPVSAAAHADLTRGRRAMARTRVRRTATGLVGVAAAGALGVGLTRQGGHDDAVAVATPGTPTTKPAPVDPTPYDGLSSQDPSGYDRPGLAFEQAPAGWEVQGITASYVTFGQAGDDPDPQTSGSKIMVSLELNDPFGEKRVIDGRTFWVDDAVTNPYHTTVMTLSPHDPNVLIRAQFGKHRWDVESALAFVAGVRVLDAAMPSRG
jgi:hypothetical protein